MPTATPRAASAVLVWAAILILYVVWGSTYLAIRVAVETFPPFVMGAVRFSIAGTIMVVVAIVGSRAALARPSLRELRDLAIIGTCLMFGGMGLVSWAEQTVPSGITGVLIALMPMWVAVYERVFFGARLPGLAMAGIALGIIGVVILVGQGLGADSRLDPIGIAALVASPMAWAAGTTFAAHGARLPSNPILATGLEMLLGSLVLVTAAVVSGELWAFKPETLSGDAILATGYLTIAGSLVAFTAFVWVIRHAPLPLVTTYAFVNPVIAVFLGWLLLREVVDPIQLVAGGVIVFGVALIIVARSRMSSPETLRERALEREDAAVAA
jgi:drug/metabolite transporter (DMT)-like permease